MKTSQDFQIFITLQGFRRPLRRLTESLTELVRVIRSDAPAVTEESLRQFYKNGGILYLAFHHEQKKIVGMVSLVPICKVNSRTWRIEHVVVLPEFHGQGLGRELCEYALTFVNHSDARYIDLTCNPKNVPANKLYASLGFKLRSTNPYRYSCRE